MDSQGKVVWTQTREYPQGINQEELDLGAISAGGVLYYQLETATERAMSKMIKL
jgi:hypothetical protein